MKVVGLTGGIGSGKTIISKVFETMGCVIYNSDDKAKEIYFKENIRKKIIELIGEKSYLSPTEINKKYISETIFNNSILLEKLNSIIHPEVKNDFISFQQKQNQNSIIIKESALLFEKDIYKELSFNILVVAPKELKIDRIKNRSNLSDIEIEKRMMAQWQDDKKTPLANYIIDNSGDISIIEQVISCIHKINNHV
jgi:dephospho-CoA kinase